MKRLAIVVVVTLAGCAYTADSVRGLPVRDLCEIVYDRGSISGVPEKNAKAELASRGENCDSFLDIRAKADAQTIRCMSTPVLGSVQTTCR
jgi:hypothetical protein